MTAATSTKDAGELRKKPSKSTIQANRMEREVNKITAALVARGLDPKQKAVEGEPVLTQPVKELHLNLHGRNQDGSKRPVEKIPPPPPPEEPKSASERLALKLSTVTPPEEAPKPVPPYFAPKHPPLVPIFTQMQQQRAAELLKEQQSMGSSGSRDYSASIGAPPNTPSRPLPPGTPMLPQRLHSIEDDLPVPFPTPRNTLLPASLPQASTSAPGGGPSTRPTTPPASPRRHAASEHASTSASVETRVSTLPSWAQPPIEPPPASQPLASQPSAPPQPPSGDKPGVRFPPEAPAADPTTSGPMKPSPFAYNPQDEDMSFAQGATGSPSISTHTSKAPDLRAHLSRPPDPDRLVTALSTMPTVGHASRNKPLGTHLSALMPLQHQLDPARVRTRQLQEQELAQQRGPEGSSHSFSSLQGQPRAQSPRLAPLSGRLNSSSLSGTEAGALSPTSPGGTNPGMRQLNISPMGRAVLGATQPGSPRLPSIGAAGYGQPG